MTSIPPLQKMSKLNVVAACYRNYERYLYREPSVESEHQRE